MARSPSEAGGGSAGVGTRVLKLRRVIRATAAAQVLVVSVGCGGGGGGEPPPPPEPPAPPPEPPPPAPGGLRFNDVTALSGISYEHAYAYPPPASEPKEFGGGVASGDFDGDGLVDLFVLRGDIGPNLLYRNVGGNAFEEVAEAAGVAYTKSQFENYRHSGPAFADVDGDGDLDLFVGGIEYDPSFLFRNEGDTTFTDVSVGSGIDTVAARYTLSAAFGDYDLDGDLDMFLTHWGTPRGIGDQVDTEHLWRNDTVGGVIRFTDVSLLAGIAPDIIEPEPVESFSGAGFDYTFSPTFARIDGDRFPDLLITGDFRTSMVYLNNTDGTFRNATDRDVIVDRNGMGSAVGDYDGDGDLDWFVTSIWSRPDENGDQRFKLGNRLYNNEGGVFADVTDAAGVHDGGWGWAACFADFDNDTDLDIYHTNGWIEPFAPDHFDMDASRLFVAAGDGTFTEAADAAGVSDRERGYAAVCADFDNDGDVDIFQAHRNTGNAATLWRNDSPANDYLKVRLVGSPPNTEAAGARIRATVGDKELLREIVIGSNYTSQNPTVQLFGLGEASSVDKLVVEWPDGSTTTRTGVTSGTTLVLEQPDR